MTVTTTEETRVEEKEKKQKEFLCLLRCQWSVHHNLVTLSPPVAVSKLDFFAWKQNILYLVMVYSALYNNVFKALALFLNKYVAEIQLPGKGIWLLSMPQTLYIELAINITKCKEQRQLE